MKIETTNGSFEIEQNPEDDLFYFDPTDFDPGVAQFGFSGGYETEQEAIEAARQWAKTSAYEA